ncbi:MAG: Mannosylfructose-phosphate synthase [Pseudomonadota bacterium]
MKPLPGLNLIFHSIGLGGGMERHVADLINYASGKSIPLRVVTRQQNWPGEPPPCCEFVVIPDRTPFTRLNTLLFESRALYKCQPQWPTIGISRVPGVVMSIVGGTHKGHLLDKKRGRVGYFDSRTIARENEMYRQAKVIVAHSGKVAIEIARLYDISPKKISILYPPVNTTTFSLEARKERDKLREQIGVAPDQFLLLFPSNNHALKGADLILEALHDFDPRIRLAVAGKTRLNAPNAINLGFCKDMPALYGAADAVILASHYEAFGLVGPEAVLCGTPALFAKTVGAAEVLSEDACIQFDRNVPSLREALGKALNKFESNTLQLSAPANHIKYPFSPSQHFDQVFNLLAEAYISG